MSNKVFIYIEIKVIIELKIKLSFIFKEIKNIKQLIIDIISLYIFLDKSLFRKKFEMVEFDSSKSGNKEKIAEITIDKTDMGTLNSKHDCIDASTPMVQ